MKVVNKIDNIQKQECETVEQVKEIKTTIYLIPFEIEKVSVDEKRYSDFRNK